MVETESLNYPSKEFTRRALRALRSGKKLAVTVRSGWRSRVLRKEFEKIPLSDTDVRDAKKTGKEFPSSFIVIFQIAPVITVHFYALSGGYRMGMESDDPLKFVYSPPVQEPA